MSSDVEDLVGTDYRQFAVLSAYLQMGASHKVAPPPPCQAADFGWLCALVHVGGVQRTTANYLSDGKPNRIAGPQGQTISAREHVFVVITCKSMPFLPKCLMG